MGQLNILLVNKFLYPKGGSETYLFNIGEYLKKQGHNVDYFGLRHKNNLVGNCIDEYVSDIDTKNYTLKRFIGPLRLIYSFEAKRKIRKVIKATKPDIVHINNYNFQLTPSILYEMKKYNIPIVMTLHDFQLVCPNHMLYMEHENRICEECKDRNYQNCIKNKCIHNSKLKSILGAIEGFTYYKLGTYKKLIDYFIAPSRFLKDKMIEFGEDSNKIKVISNFSSGCGDFNTTVKNEYVLYFGRISIQKGIKTLIEACKRLPNIKFILAGSGELEDELRKVENIQFVGFKSGAELNKLIQGALFSLCTSECYDNCPMSVIESQIQGTPVIGAAIGGIPELIADGFDGLLYEAGNVQDLVQKIRYLYENKDILREFSVRCREKVKELNSIENYYLELMGIYSLVLKKKYNQEQKYQRGIAKLYE